MSMEMQMQQEPKLTLKVRAAEAQRSAQHEINEQHEQRYREDCEAAARLLNKVLGVEREALTFRRRNEYGSAIAEVEGLSFTVFDDDFEGSLQLLSSCENCGGERSATVRSLTRLGEILAGAPFDYHYCSAQGAKGITPESRLLDALRDFIEENVSAAQEQV